MEPVKESAESLTNQDVESVLTACDQVTELCQGSSVENNAIQVKDQLRESSIDNTCLHALRKKSNAVSNPFNQNNKPSAHLTVDSKEETMGSNETLQEGNISALSEFSIICEKDNSSGAVNDLTALESDNSMTPRKRSWMLPENRLNSFSLVHRSCVSEQSSNEEGELTPSVLTTDDSLPSVENCSEKRRSKRLCYSSFIVTSEEDGECVTSYFDSSDEDAEVTIIENRDVVIRSHDHENRNNGGMIEICTEEGGVKVCSEIYNETDSIDKFQNVSDTDASLNEIVKTGREPAKKKSHRRKLPSENYYESTPKKRHLFIPEDREKQLLSPIEKISREIIPEEQLTDVATPLIESKFQVLNTDMCSTPLSKSEDSLTLNSAVVHSDSKFGHNSERHKICNPSVFSGFDDKPSLQPDDTDIMITVDELIADITQLCESINASFEDAEEDQSCCKPSKPEVTASVRDQKINDTGVSTCSFEDEKESDITITVTEPADKAEKNIEEVDPVSGQTDLDEPLGIKTDTNEESNGESVNESQRSAGRFKDLLVVSKTDITEYVAKANGQDTDTCNISEEDCVDDILCLERYDDDDAAYVDQNLLEKSHFVAALEKAIAEEYLNDSVSNSLKSDIKIDEKNEEKTVDSVHHSEDEGKKCEKVKDQTDDSSCQTIVASVSETKDNVSEGLDSNEFDTYKYRKNVVSLAEKESCRRWGTLNIGAPRSDVNLTVAATFHENKATAGEIASSGYLESDSIVCTYMCEDDMSCKLNRLTCTSTDQMYMEVENILCRLENQKQLLVDMRHDSLVVLKGEIERKKSAMRKRHINEYNFLFQRHGVQFDEMTYRTRTFTNHSKIQNELQVLRHEHSTEMNSLKQIHRNEFSSLSAKGKEKLNKLVTQYDLQAEPLDEIIEHLKYDPYHSSILSYRYGPPVSVHLRKGPCKDTNWEHSTVRMCLPAGIGQAVTLEDDLYDHHYSW